MKISDNGLDFIKAFETFVAWPYHGAADKPGVMTVGYGHVIRAYDRIPYPMSPESATELLRKDCEQVESDIQRVVTVVLNQNQYDALCSFVFNVGMGHLEFTPFMKHLNAGHFDVACEHWKLFDVANGVKVAGLENRRLAEIALFNKPVVKGVG
jgi:lysozyme